MRRPITADPTEPAPRPARVGAFVALGLALYALLFLGAEWLTRGMAEHNPIHRIQAADPGGHDWIILGASHAMPLDFQGFGAEIARATDQRLLNLAAPGTGPLYHRFIAERFFATHRAQSVLLVVDSFGFYSAQWNEDRFADRDLLARTPFDPVTLRLFVRYLAHGVDPRALLDYATGFSKINNHDRLQPDRWEAEERFERSPRPSAFADQERIDYLYPQPPDPAAMARYLDHLVALIEVARAGGAEVVVIKPPIPARFAALLPDEPAFDTALAARLAAAGAPFHDFAAVLPEPGYYFDPDHLNRRGAEQFLETHLAPILSQTASAPPR
jgi:hypothetical protein